MILLAYPKHLTPFTIGMESVLVMLFIPLFLLLVWRSRLSLAGLAALFLVMSRLDSLVYVVFPITLYAAFRKRSRPPSVAKRGLEVGGPAVVVESCPVDAVWAATDCGRVAFWTGATFINLDGLINGFEYQAALKQHDLCGYLERAGVDYLVVGAWETEPATRRSEPMYAHRVDRALYRCEYDTYDFFVYSYMYGCCSDTLTLRWDQEVWRSNPEIDGTISATTVVFELAQRSR